MKGTTSWAFRPYHPYSYDGTDIFIGRVVPDTDSILIEWFFENKEDEGKAPVTVCFRKRNEEEFERFDAAFASEHTFTGLTDDTEYEFWVESGEHKSKKRLARTGRQVGTVINYLHPEDPVYDYVGHTLGSPSLLKLPSGTLLAGMDIYTNACPQNVEIIFRSDDGGKTWHYVTELMPCFWGKLFLHKGELYILGTSNEYGDLLIGKSNDEGKTWTFPTVLFRGSCNRFFPGFLTCPTPIVELNGRLWKAVEYGDRRCYEKENPIPNKLGLISVSVDADILDASNWTLSDLLDYDPNWEGAPVPIEGCKCQGSMESNAVVGPDGELWVIPRFATYNCVPDYGRIAVYKADKNDPEKMMSFYKFIDFNGNTSKFEIIKDEKTGWYINVLNGLDERNRNRISARDLMMLYKSKDLENWEYVTTVTDLIDHIGEGSQNASLVIDGDDLLMTCRTAINKPMGPMYANYQTFHKIENFRELL